MFMYNRIDGSIKLVKNLSEFWSATRYKNDGIKGTFFPKLAKFQNKVFRESST